MEKLNSPRRAAEESDRRAPAPTERPGLSLPAASWGVEHADGAIQRRLAQTVAASKHQQAQGRAAEAIGHGLPMQRQREQLQGLFATQRQAVVQRNGPTLALGLRSGRSVGIRQHANPTLFEFVDRRGSYLAADQLTVTGQAATLSDEDLDRQVESYFGGVLRLWRGVTRQHPLWYEVRYLHILQPLGSGELPSFATNKTAYIPFGHSLPSAEGIAINHLGMGPGDERRMVAGLYGPGEPDEEVEVGATIEVGVGHRSHRVAFYNSREIQVYGPIEGITPQVVKLPRRDLPPPPTAEEERAYVSAHGSKRHQKIEDALGVDGLGRLQQIGDRLNERQNTALDLLRMRELMWQSYAVEYDGIRDSNHASQVDSGANREGHAEYLVQILAGTDRQLAIQRGVAAGVDFFWRHRYNAYAERTGHYQYVWTARSDTGGTIDVLTRFEDAAIGRLTYAIEAVGAVAPPARDQPYTREHVLGRQPGRVCHLQRIMNFSLIRPGPADIYRGFANTLMAMVEVEARERGARLIYLEPSKTPVRVGPNSKEMAPADPTAFYTGKHGYTSDAQAAVHNALVTEEQFKGMDVDPEALARQKRAYNEAMLGGILTKAL